MTYAATGLRFQMGLELFTAIHYGAAGPYKNVICTVGRNVIPYRSGYVAAIQGALNRGTARILRHRGNRHSGLGANCEGFRRRVRREKVRAGSEPRLKAVHLA